MWPGVSSSGPVPLQSLQNHTVHHSHAIPQGGQPRLQSHGTPFLPWKQPNSNPRQTEPSSVPSLPHQWAQGAPEKLVQHSLSHCPYSLIYWRPCLKLCQLPVEAPVSKGGGHCAPSTLPCPPPAYTASCHWGRARMRAPCSQLSAKEGSAGSAMCARPALAAKGDLTAMCLSPALSPPAGCSLCPLSKDLYGRHIPAFVSWWWSFGDKGRGCRPPVGGGQKG